MRTSESLGVTVTEKYSVLVLNILDKGQSSAVDPGFPLGGCRPVRGADLRRRCFSMETYVKSKELGFRWGVEPAAPPGSATGHGTQVFQTTLHSNYVPAKQFVSKLEDSLWKSNLRQLYKAAA